MGVDGRLLMLRLEPAVRPAGSPVDPARADAAPTLDGRGFADLLREARAGAIRSDRAPDLSRLDAEMPGESVERIAGALDMLEAHGRDRAVIVYADRMLVADVRTRTIEGELLAHDGPRPEPVDAAVRVPTPDEERRTPAPRPPHAVSVPSSVLELLEARDSQS